MFGMKSCIHKFGFCSLNLESLIRGLLNSVSGTKAWILFKKSCFLEKRKH